LQTAFIRLCGIWRAGLEKGIVSETVRRRREMKKILAPAAILFSLIFLMGMGGLGGTPVEKIPTPDKNFHARIVDRDGVQTSLSQFSHDGKTFLSGKRGEGLVAVPFEKISQVQFRTEGKSAVAKVSLRDEHSVEIMVEKQTKFYGQAEFGTFQIEAKDLKSLSFQP
jgi:hypothetical protein